MNLKQVAVKRTAIFAASALLLGVANSVAVTYFGIEYGIRFVYQTEVDRLERENILKKIKDAP